MSKGKNQDSTYATLLHGEKMDTKQKKMDFSDLEKLFNVSWDSQKEGALKGIARNIFAGLQGELSNSSYEFEELKPHLIGVAKDYFANRIDNKLLGLDKGIGIDQALKNLKNLAGKRKAFFDAVKDQCKINKVPTAQAYQVEQYCAEKFSQVMDGCNHLSDVDSRLAEYKSIAIERIKLVQTVKEKIADEVFEAITKADQEIKGKGGAGLSNATKKKLAAACIAPLYWHMDWLQSNADTKNEDLEGLGKPGARLLSSLKDDLQKAGVFKDLQKDLEASPSLIERIQSICRNAWNKTMQKLGVGESWHISAIREDQLGSKVTFDTKLPAKDEPVATFGSNRIDKASQIISAKEAPYVSGKAMEDYQEHMQHNAVAIEAAEKARKHYPDAKKPSATPQMNLMDRKITAMKEGMQSDKGSKGL